MATKENKENKGLVVLGKDEPAGEAGEHEEIRKQVLDLRDRSDEDAWALADTLIQVYRGGYYLQWGFAAWSDYVKDELDFSLRKAQFLIRTQEWLNGLPKNVQTWVRKLGWRKARMLVGIVTPENAADWKARIGTSCSTAKLDEMLHSDAVEKANDPDGKGADAGSERQPPFSLGRPTPAQRANLELAEERGAKLAGCEQSKDRKAYIWDLIATEFLAGNAGIRTVQEYLGNIERTLGLKLVAYDEKEDAVVFGSELLERLGEGLEDEDGMPMEAEVQAPAEAVAH